MWLSRLFPKRSPNRGSKPWADRRPTTRFRPRLHGLEDRWLPSQIGLSVISLADSGLGSLRAAILTADAGSHSDKFTIGFGVSGAIDLQSPLPDLNNSIAIQGPGANSLIIERGAGFSFTSAIVTVDAGQAASLSGLTIANGNAGGIANNGTLTVSACTISSNSGQNGGGISSTGMVTISDSALIGNTASHDGGGIWNYGTLKVSTSTLSGNGAGGDAGGAILNGGTLSLTTCTVADNFAAVGGGIYILNGGSATIQQNSTLSGNSAASGGGIINGGTLTVRDSTLSVNAATGFDFGGHHFPGRGGGIDNEGVATIQDSTLSGNSAEVGGGISNEAVGTLDVRGSTASGNTASDSGGALYNLGTATSQQCSLSGNYATSAGGGIFNGASATLTIDDSVVVGNVAPLGADLDDLGSTTLNDSTVGVIGH